MLRRVELPPVASRPWPRAPRRTFAHRIQGAVAANDRAELAQLLQRAVEAYRWAIEKCELAISKETEARRHFLSGLASWAGSVKAEEAGHRFNESAESDRIKADDAGRRYALAALERNRYAKSLSRCSEMLRVASRALGKCVGSARGVV